MSAVQYPTWETVVIRGQKHSVDECISCGVVFTVPLTMIKNKWASGGEYHCPSGHGQGWGVGHVEREDLRRERDRLKQRVAQLNDDVKAAADRAEKTAAELKRHKQLSAAGVCPCCNRSFENLRRHMATKHPDQANVVALKA